MVSVDCREVRFVDRLVRPLVRLTGSESPSRAKGNGHDYR